VALENVIINTMFSGKCRLLNLDSKRHVMFIAVHGAERLDVDRVYVIPNMSSHRVPRLVGAQPLGACGEGSILATLAVTY
jgi:hypothetical protein